MRQIKLSEMAPHVHSFLPRENKVEKLSKWLISWIAISLQNGKIKPYDMLPSKADFAAHIGVSLGTMQNVFRSLEDAGYVESKQKIGTYIKDRRTSQITKLTSKKDLATDIIKKFLKENSYKTGDALPSTRRLAQFTGISNTTIRAAITHLVFQGILTKRKKSFILTGRSYNINEITAKTLVDKITEKLKIYIKSELKTGDKLLPSSELAKKFKVSSKTIHDSIKNLTKEGILYSRRGKYGTIVINNQSNFDMIYNYEKIEQEIRNYIVNNCQIGDKLPSIKIFAKQLQTSEKTVKKALDNLSEDSYITFMRGRYGGTFVTDIPQKSSSAYTWLAISNDYVGTEN